MGVIYSNSPVIYSVGLMLILLGLGFVWRMVYKVSMETDYNERCYEEGQEEAKYCRRELTDLRLDTAKEAEKHFEVYAKNVFKWVHKAWTDRDARMLWCVASKSLYSKHIKALRSYIRVGEINVVQVKGVEDVDLVGHKVAGGKEEVVVRIKAKVVSYVVSEENPLEIIRGTEEAKLKEYKLTFMRCARKQEAGENVGLIGGDCADYVLINYQEYI